jgi:pre-sodorifen synthase
MTARELVQVVESPRLNPYRNKVVRTYDDPPEHWHKALGSDNLLFQFGLFDANELAAGPMLGSVGPSEVRHVDRQLELAGLAGPDRPPLHRILDLGCGWGGLSRLLMDRFPECARLDAVNISPRQLEYCARRLVEHGLTERIRLFLCDGQDVDLLPDPDPPYDLVVTRGVYTHFPPDIFRNSVRAVYARLRPGGVFLISDNLYTIDLADYESSIPDDVDRLACGNRKSPDYFAEVLRDAGFTVFDMQVLPSNEEVAHWFGMVRRNIERHFPDGVTGPIEELRVMAMNVPVALQHNKVSVYSVLARRP